MAAEVGYIDKAYELYEDTVRMDLDNLHKNSMHGVHTAAMGGSYLGIVYGFAGLRIKDDTIHFNPVVPKEMEGYRFNIQIRNSLINVYIRDNQATYTLKKGEMIEFFHNDNLVSLEEVGDFINL
jgi:alpha,alpha-trehalose phosphorylase